MLTLCALLLWTLASSTALAAVNDVRLSDERVVFQLETGEVEFAFYPDVAPATSAHIFECVQLGLYNTNHFFRVHPGFVAQTAECEYGRLAPLNDRQKEVAHRTVPFEWKDGVVTHTAGSLSLAKGDEPHSGGSSFSIMLSPHPGLDTRYAVFGRVTRGMEVIHALEKLETKEEGGFVMPLKRVTILATYWYVTGAKPLPGLGELLPLLQGSKAGSAGAAAGDSTAVETTTTQSHGECEIALREMTARYEAVSAQVEELRSKALP